MSPYRESRCAACWDYLVPFTRFWGAFTAVVVFGVGVDVAFHHHVMGIYVTIGAVIVFFLEITWAITLFLQVCLRNEYSPVFRCWDCVLWLDRWKKSLLYAVFAAVLLLKPHRLWLSSVAGSMLVLLALLYLVLSCRARSATKETLLHNREESFDRFDDAADMMDDSVPGPLGESLSDSLVEQDVMLEM
ncbi:uncharacterized protein LOC126246576 [Schistocerca nitens]|uniref:uncharacterized protein LOC126246576 n=1 Tax=Schistocerca nitens TaxID=7011 RepID=UPI00211790F4|nr:uncharacterized protein LOC126246576 [Schistocerca nitens]